jgi:RNA polymerase sigma factor (TIGR02999 family)
MNEERKSQVTGLLDRASSGDARATNELFPLVYDELRRIAAQHLGEERIGHTLQPTALVHEAYLRLVGSDDVKWENRAHFFGAAAQAIRRILVDHARTRGRLKRGGPDLARTPLEGLDMAAPPSSDTDMLALDEALTRLNNLDPAKARVVELRYFGGLSLEDTARTMDISVATVSRYWEFARVWLHRELSQSPPDPQPNEAGFMPAVFFLSP